MIFLILFLLIIIFIQAQRLIEFSLRVLQLENSLLIKGAKDINRDNRKIKA